MVNAQRLEFLDNLYGALLQTLQIERSIVIATIQENEMDTVTTDLISRLNDATNKIAARLQALIDKATQAGSVAAGEIDAALSPIVTQLEAMGQDPANPVPPAPPAAA